MASFASIDLPSFGDQPRPFELCQCHMQSAKSLAQDPIGWILTPSEMTVPLPLSLSCLPIFIIPSHLMHLSQPTACVLLCSEQRTKMKQQTLAMSTFVSWLVPLPSCSTLCTSVCEKKLARESFLRQLWYA